MPASIFIIDDHKIVRDGLKASLLPFKGYQIIGEAASAEESRTKLSGRQVDLIFVDIRLPDVNGAVFIKELKQLQPDAKYILLTAEPNKLDMDRAMQAGASGFLTKDIDSSEYAHAIRTVLEGGKYISQAFSHLLINAPAHLSERELEVLQHFADGLPYKQIADKLDISTRTVETHKINILKKLEVETPIEMVRKAIKLGLIKA